MVGSGTTESSPSVPLHQTYQSMDGPVLGSRAGNASNGYEAASVRPASVRVTVPRSNSTQALVHAGLHPAWRSPDARRGTCSRCSRASRASARFRPGLPATGTRTPVFVRSKHARCLFPRPRPPCCLRCRPRRPLRLAAILGSGSPQRYGGADPGLPDLARLLTTHRLKPDGHLGRYDPRGLDLLPAATSFTFLSVPIGVYLLVIAPDRVGPRSKSCRSR